MGQFIELLLASAGGTAIILLIIAFLARTWIATRIQESIKFDYAKDIEKYKADLAQENAREIEKFKSFLQEGNARSVREVQNELEHEAKIQAVDNSTFVKLLNLLPSDGVISFLKDHCFSGSFERHTLDPLYDFVLKWKDAEHSFLSSRLDEELNALRIAINDFLDDLGANTFVIDPNSKFLSVPKIGLNGNPRFFKKRLNA